MGDPLFVAIQEAVELVIQRGIEVRPLGDGFYVRLASKEVAEDMNASVANRSERAW